MKNLYIVCDYREQFPSEIEGEKIYNDHISKKALEDLIYTIHKCGYNVEYLGGVNELIDYYHNERKMSEGIYINLNDGRNEKHKRGQTPLLLELLGVSYTGCDPFHALLASDKYFTQLCLRQNHILCPQSVLINNADNIEEIYTLSPPLIVKPNYEGSSIGVDSSNFSTNHKYAIAKASDLLNSFDEVIVEEYISGYEVTNLIISNKKSGKILLNEALVISLNEQFYLHSEIFGIEEKSSNLRKYWRAHQLLPKNLTDKIAQLSEQIVKILKLPNFVRIDYRIKGDDVYFLEVNTNPAFGQTSDVGKLCKLAGYTFEDFVAIFIASLID